MCHILQVSRSAYYGWYSGQSHQASDSDKKLAKSVTEVFQVHISRYGSRLIMLELRKRDLFVSRKTLPKTMQKLDMKAIQTRSFVPRTTDSRHCYHVIENLLLHSGPATSLNRIWVGDITYIPMAGGGWSYLSTWMDLYARRIVGWKLAYHMKETLVIESFKRARRRRSVPKGADRTCGSRGTICR
jgi:putative transposase